MKLSGLRIMITGAAGFIGSHLADRLAKNNNLLLIDDFSVGSMENLALAAQQPAVRIVQADVTNRERMQELTSGIQVVFHLAMSCLRTSINQPLLSHDINAGGTLNMCLAAQEHKVERLIYVSSSEVYGTAQTVPMSETHPCHPTTVYGASKLAGELYALAYWRTHGLPVSVVRPFNTYGPREPYQGSRAEVVPRFLLQLETGQSPVIYGDGNQTRDFTFIDDTVNGLVQAAEADALVGDIVNIANGHELPIKQIAAMLAALTNTTHIPVVYETDRPGDVYRHYADIGKAKQLLGFVPHIDIQSGLAQTVEWFRTQQIVQRVEAGLSGTPNW